MPSPEAWHRSGDLFSEMAQQEGLEGARVSKAFANDLMLALSCRESGCVLVTENDRDFSRIRRFISFEYVKPWPAYDADSSIATKRSVEDATKPKARKRRSRSRIVDDLTANAIRDVAEASSRAESDTPLLVSDRRRLSDTRVVERIVEAPAPVECSRDHRFDVDWTV